MALAKLKCGAARLKAKYPTRKYEDRFKDKASILHGPYQSFQDFSYTKEEALERLACALVMFTTQSTSEDLLDRAVEVGQAAMLVNTFDLCDTTSSMLSRHEIKEALAMVQQHQDDANFDELVKRAEMEAKLKASAERITLRKGYHRHLFTDTFVRKQLSSQEPSSAEATKSSNINNLLFSKAEAMEWLARSIVKFGLALDVPSKQPKLKWWSVSLVEARLLVQTFDSDTQTTTMLQHPHVKQAQLLVDQVQDVATLDGLRKAVTLEEKCIVSAFRTTCQPTNYLRKFERRFMS